MTARFPQIRTLLVGVAFGLLLGGLVLGRAPGIAQGKRPNVIVIQTDDQSRLTFKGHYRGADGRSHRIMPEMVRGIVRSGAEFRNYYVATPVCSPSRASMLTGQYPENSGLRKNTGDLGGWSGWQALPTWEDNVPVALQRAGYRTSHFGKLLNGYYRGNGRVETTVPPGWDRWRTVSFVSSTPYYGYSINNNGRVAGPFGKKRYSLLKRNTVDPAACRVNTVRANGRPCLYLTDAVTRSVLKEIRRNGRRDAAPFYMQIDYQAPHGDRRPPLGPTPPTRYAGSASRTVVPRSPAFNEADMSDKPEVIRDSAGPPMRGGQIGELNSYYRRYVEAVRGVDDGVGAILRTLRRTGQLRNTYVFYLTDHGLFFGEHRFDRAKFLGYNAASRAGMAVRGPGIPQGVKVNEVVGNIDVPATVLRLTGAEPGFRVDGRPLGRFWRNPGRTTRRPFQISLFNGEWGAAGARAIPAGAATVSGKAPAVSYRGFRVGPYKYLRYLNGESELYDLRRDPFELRNRAESPRYFAVRQYMRNHLPEVKDCAGESCRAELPPWPEPGD